MPKKKQATEDSATKVKPQRKSTKRKTTRKRVTKPKATRVTKEALPREKESARLSVTDTTPDIEKIPVTRARLDVALFNPGRYRFNFHRIAVQTARYAGIFFVVSGALLTLINIQQLHNIYAALDEDTSKAQTTSSLTDTTNITTTNTNTESMTVVPQQPEVDIVLDAPDPDLGYAFQTTDGADEVRGQIDVRIRVENAGLVEVYLKDSSGNITKVGAASAVGNAEWLYRWNTKSWPDGQYTIYARVRNSGGFEYDDAYELLHITNNGPVSDDTELITETNQDDLHQTDRQASSTVTPQAEDKTVSTGTTTGEVRTVDLGSETDYEKVIRPEVTVTVEGSSPLQGSVELYISAKEATFVELYTVPRYGNQEQFIGLARRSDGERWTYIWNTTDKPNGEYNIFARIKNTYGLYDSPRQLVSIYNQLSSKTADQTGTTEVKQSTSDEIAALAAREPTEATTTSETARSTTTKSVPVPIEEQSESLIRERVGEAATTDTDGDGITDYDELNLYHTDPNVADTDGDGFIDGAEILSGFNPTDTTPQVLVAYESPKEKGIVREDYLVVEAITTDVPEDATERPAAIIRGRGLPNSFVTLYIFSTPIVVTVKTNDDGSWSYRFDKELADGNHEVYVGITDNAGKIVAKSNPFAFVKTAEAFTPVDASSPGIVVAPSENTQPFIGDNVMLIILSLAVVALGLVLMLLGLHMETRRPVAVLNPT